VQFIIKHDKRNTFLFAPLQSSFGQQQLKNTKLPVDEFQTIVLLKNNRVFQRSNAALEIAKDLSGMWPAMYVLKIIPRFVRDVVYNFISKNRYRIFGRTESCMIPDPNLKTKFLA
jgi:predicted DCC family thiol-disulfide oxidoreductase YuxK